MQGVQFRPRRLFAGHSICYKNAHRLQELERIYIFKTAGRKREGFLHFRALACVRIHEPVIARHQDFRRLVTVHIHKNRVAEEPEYGRPAGNLHREPCDRQARMVNRIHQVIAQEHCFRVTVTIYIADGNSRRFVLQAARACGTALVNPGPLRRIRAVRLRVIPDGDIGNRPAATDNNNIHIVIAVKIGTGYAPGFAVLAVNLPVLQPVHINCAVARYIGKLRRSNMGIVAAVGHVHDVFHFLGAGYAHFGRPRRRSVFEFVNIDLLFAVLIGKIDIPVINERARRSRICRVRFLHRNAANKRSLHELIRMQAVNILAVACKAHERAIACTHTVQRHLLLGITTGQRFLYNHSIGHK